MVAVVLVTYRIGPERAVSDPPVSLKTPVDPWASPDMLW